MTTSPKLVINTAHTKKPAAPKACSIKLSSTFIIASKTKLRQQIYLPKFNAIRSTFSKRNYANIIRKYSYAYLF